MYVRYLRIIKIGFIEHDFHLYLRHIITAHQYYHIFFRKDQKSHKHKQTSIMNIKLQIVYCHGEEFSIYFAASNLIYIII